MKKKSAKKKATKKAREWFCLIKGNDMGSLIAFISKSGANRMCKSWNVRYGDAWEIVRVREVLK